MPKSMLTQKQEDFTIYYFKTGNATQSAIQAGYSPRSAVVTASRLLTHANIQARLSAFRSTMAKPTIATVEERQERLTEFVREDIEGKFGISRHSNIQATAELNKMTGDYPPEKHAILGDIHVEVTYVNRGREKDSDQLPESTE